MNKKKLKCLRTYFRFDKPTNQNVCTINSCKYKTCCVDLVTLRRHIERCHKEQFANYHQSLLKHRALNTEFKAVTVKYNRNYLKQACLDLVINHGFTFDIMDVQAFQYIVRPIASALKCPVDSETIQTDIKETATDIRTEINDNLRNQLFSLKIDKVTHLNRTMLGINALCVVENEIQMTSLAMLELQNEYTPIDVKNIITNTLTEYDLHMDQVYAIACGSVQNTKEFDMEIDSSKEQDHFDIYFEQELTDLLIIGRNSNFQLNTMPCAEQTLNLALSDFFDSTDVRTIIKRLEKIVSELAAPPYNITSMQKIDQPSSITPNWKDTLLMLQKLNAYKHCCKVQEATHKKRLIDDEDWKFIEDFVRTLTIIDKTTKNLQSVLIALGDFYKMWLEMKLAMRNGKHRLSQSLKELLENRETELMTNKTVLACLYLDPRFHGNMTVTDKETAISHLKAVYDQLEYVKREEEDTIIDLTDEPTVKMEQHTAVASSSAEPKRLSAYKEIETFEPYRMEVSFKILDFWAVKFDEYPVLLQLARLVHVTPVTQLSVRRAVSSLQLLCSAAAANQDNQLSPDTLKDIMLIKSNKQFNYYEPVETAASTS